MIFTYIYMISQLLDISCVLRGSRPLHPSNQKLNQKLSPYWSGGDWVPKMGWTSGF